MSKSDTLRQKIERNIEYLFKESELLAKKYPNKMVFDYIEAWCHMVVLDNDPPYVIDFDDEIEMLQVIQKANPNDKALKSYHSCVVKTNEMIKEKYKNKIPNALQTLRQSLKEMGLMRKGKLPKRDINVFLDNLDKEIKEEKQEEVL